MKLDRILSDKQLLDRFHSHIPPILSGEDLLTRESWQLSQSFDMTFDEVEVIKQHVACALLQPQPAGMMTAARSAPVTLRDLPSAIPTMTPSSSSVRKARPVYPSGWSELDNLLGGGLLSPGLMTLVVGEGQSGKTQCALYTAVTNALAGHRVLFLDTQNTLSLRRLHALLDLILLERQLQESASSEGLSEAAKQEIIAEVFDHISIARLFDIFSAMDFLTKLHDEIRRDPSQGFHVIILDSFHPWITPYLTESVNMSEKFAPAQSVSVSVSVSASVNGTGNGNGTSHTLPVNNVRALSSIANVHPLISQVWTLLRALATLPSPSGATTEREMTAHTKQTDREGGIAVLVTNLVSGSSERIKRSQTSSTAPLAAEQVLQGVAGGPGVILDTFDSIIALSIQSQPINVLSVSMAEEETVLRAG